jgi:hypothetical protein
LLSIATGVTKTINPADVAFDAIIRRRYVHVYVPNSLPLEIWIRLKAREFHLLKAK